MNKPYLIVAPSYVKNCAGIKVLHKLAHLLNERGYDAVVTSGSNPEFNVQRLDGLNKDQLRAFQQYGIVVYPEIVQGNPLRFNNVVRWDLAKPAQVYPESDLVFAYNEMIIPYSKATEVLNVDEIEDYFCLPEVENRSGSCMWIGKGAGTPLVPETARSIAITHFWPSDRRNLANLFKTSEVFYTYDNFTVLIDEARLCGCPVVIIPSGQFEIKDFDNMTLGRGGIAVYPEGVTEGVKIGVASAIDRYKENKLKQEEQLLKFIEQTQAMQGEYAENYKGVNEGWTSWIPEELFR